MIVTSQPADPAVHSAACAIASRITDMLSGILMDAERGDYRRESYLIAREVIEEFFKRSPP